MPFPFAAAAPIAAAAIGAFGQHQSNAMNVRLAREQMKFQERMSSTAHQRAASDLRAAGINPLLAAGGVGASSPVGASTRIESSAAAGLHSGLSARRQQKELELLDAQIQREVTAAQLNNAHIFETTSLVPGRVNELNSRVRLTDLDSETKTRLLAFVAQEAGARIARDLSSALASRSSAALHDAESILKRFQQDEFRNMSTAQKDWWLRTLGPYLHSAGQFGRALNAAAVPFVAGQAIGKKVFDRFKD